MNTFEPDEGLDGDPRDVLDEQIRQVEESRHTDKRQKWWLFALFMFTLILAAAVGFLLIQSWAETERERQTTATVQSQKQEIAQEAQKALCGTEEREIYDRDLCAKWTELAETPAPTVEIVDVSREEIVDAFRAYCEAGNCRGANGRTPTPDDVAAAFARFCGDGNCQGEPGIGVDGSNGVDGTDGVDGANATPEMVLAAVTDYCADGRCVGATGANGEPGPPPSAEAIQAAVNAFCANGACVGPAGPPGADSTVPGPVGPIGATGQPGAQGRGIASIQCQQEPEYAWIVTYTDGTSEAVPGPCRAADPVIPVPIPDDD